MNLTQNWIGYCDRSYQQIKQSVLNTLYANNPEITDFSESNPLIILISIFAAIGEMLNLYIDAMARECFIGTMRKYTSAINLVKLTDYRIKAVISPTADLTFTLMSGGVVTPYTGGIITIPINCEIDSNQNSIPFISQQQVVLNPGQTVISVPVSSYSLVNNITLGTSNGTANQAFQIEDDYAHGSMVLTIGSDTWALYTSLGYMQSGTLGFIVDILPDGNPYIIFGDGINGAIPATGLSIVGNYKTSVGTLGNLPPNSITQLITTITSLPSGYSFSITNTDYSSNGADIQGLSDIQNMAPRDLRTLNRAVSASDYEDLAILAPGVGNAEVSYCCCCGTKITVYIGPYSRGIASSVLLDDTGLYFVDKKIIGRKLSILPAGITRIWMDIGIVAANGYSVLATTSAAILALDNNFGYSSSSINPTLQPADFINVLKSLPQISNVSINSMYLEPYARPILTTTSSLQITWGQVIASSNINYTLQYDYNSGSPRFLLYKNNLFYSYIVIGALYNDGAIISFTVFDTGLYTNGMQWSFTIFPSYPTDFTDYSLEVTDYSIPIVDVNYSALVGGVPTIFSNLTVTPFANSSNCLTNC